MNYRLGPRSQFRRIIRIEYQPAIQPNNAAIRAKTLAKSSAWLMNHTNPLVATEKIEVINPRMGWLSNCAFSLVTDGHGSGAGDAGVSRRT